MRAFFLGLFSLVLALALVGGPSGQIAEAVAQAGALSFSGPLELRGEFQRSSSNSCSMSYAYGHSRLAYVLRVDAAGHVELEVDGSSRSFIGDARGRYSAGGGSDVSEIGHALHAVLEGVASRTGGSLSVRLATGTFSRAYWSGPGTLPLGPPETLALSNELTCTYGSEPVFPAGPAVAGETATVAPVAHCQWVGGPPNDLNYFAGEAFYLATQAGVLEVRDETELGAPGGSSILRAR